MSIYTIRNKATGSNVVYIGVEDPTKEAVIDLGSIAAPDETGSVVKVSNKRLTTQTISDLSSDISETSEFTNAVNSVINNYTKTSPNIIVSEPQTSDKVDYTYYITISNNTMCAGSYLFISDALLESQIIHINTSAAYSGVRNYVKEYNYIIIIFIPDNQAKYNIVQKSLAKTVDTYTASISDDYYFANNVICARKLYIYKNNESIVSEVIDNLSKTTIKNSFGATSDYEDDSSVLAVSANNDEIYIVHPKQLTCIEISKNQYYNTNEQSIEETARYYQIVTDTTKYVKSVSTDVIPTGLNYLLNYDQYFSGYLKFKGISYTSTATNTNGNSATSTNSSTNSVINKINYYSPGVAEGQTTSNVIGAGTVFFSNVAFHTSAQIETNYEDYHIELVDQTNVNVAIKSNTGSRFKVVNPSNSSQTIPYNINVIYDLTKQKTFNNIIGSSGATQIMQNISGDAVFKNINYNYFYQSANVVDSYVIGSNDYHTWVDNNEFDESYFNSYADKYTVATIEDLQSNINTVSLTYNDNASYNKSFVIIPCSLKTAINTSGLEYVCSATHTNASTSPNITINSDNVAFYDGTNYSIMVINQEFDSTHAKLSIPFNESYYYYYSSAQIADPYVISSSDEHTWVNDGTFTDEKITSYANKYKTCINGIESVLTSNIMLSYNSNKPDYDKSFIVIPKAFKTSINVEASKYIGSDDIYFDANNVTFYDGDVYSLMAINQSFDTNHTAISLSILE